MKLYHKVSRFSCNVVIKEFNGLRYTEQRTTEEKSSEGIHLFVGLHSSWAAFGIHDKRFLFAVCKLQSDFHGPHSKFSSASMQKSPSNSCTSHAFGGRPTKRNWIEMHFGEELAWMPWISTLSQSTLIGAGTCQCRAVDIRAVVGKGGFDFSASSVQLRLWLLRFILTSKASNPPEVPVVHPGSNREGVHEGPRRRHLHDLRAIKVTWKRTTRRIAMSPRLVNHFGMVTKKNSWLNNDHYYYQPKHYCNREIL